MVQVYAARTINWKGWLSVHSWIATKEKDADYYETYQVMGYRVFRGGEAVSVKKDIPDRRWFGAEPELIEELRGEKAERAITQIKKLVAEYPYNRVYRIWPGPNSNTFVSHIIRHVPELTVELPPHAIGKDWIDDGRFFRPQRKRFRLSVFCLRRAGNYAGQGRRNRAEHFGAQFRHRFLSSGFETAFCRAARIKRRTVGQALKFNSDYDPAV